MKAIVPVWGQDQTADGRSFRLGLMDFAYIAPSIEPYEPRQGDCALVFATEAASVLQERFQGKPDLDPFALKVWVDRINAYRSVVGVDTVTLNRCQSEMLVDGKGFVTVTLQERLALLHVYLGLTAEKSAEQLCRSTSSVRAYRASVRQKLGLPLSPIVISRLIYAHRAIEAMNYSLSEAGSGLHLVARDI